MSERILIVGAGISGISSAVWLHSLGLPFDWVDHADDIGGTLRRVGNVIDEIPGFPPLDGPSLVERYRTHLDRLNLQPKLGVSVTRIAHTSSHDMVVVVDDQPPAPYTHVLLCTGTDVRTLGLEHERSRRTKGVEISVTRVRHRYAGKDVAVVGGGDGALEGALLLAEVCRHVDLIHRRDQFRAQQRFIDRVHGCANMTVHPHTEVTRIDPSEHDDLRGIALNNGAYLPVSGLFVRIGTHPVYPEGLAPLIASNTYIPTDSNEQSAYPGLFIIGDCGSAGHKSVAWSMGSAARAVYAIRQSMREHARVQDR